MWIQTTAVAFHEQCELSSPGQKTTVFVVLGSSASERGHQYGAPPHGTLPHTCKWQKLLCFTLFHKHVAKPAPCISSSATLFTDSDTQVLSEFIQGATIMLPTPKSAHAFGRFQSSCPLACSPFQVTVAGRCRRNSAEAIQGEMPSQRSAC